MSEKIQQITHTEAGHGNGNFDRSWRDEQWGNRKLTTAAEDTAHNEKTMTTWQAVRANPSAIAWSLAISTCVIMEGYDTNLLGTHYHFHYCGCPD